MSQVFRSIKGTFDVLPQSHTSEGSAVVGSAAWQFVEQTIRDVLGRFHFAEIRTPLIEHRGLFERSVGPTSDIVTKEMFAIPRTREVYVMRPEVTASVMRAYMQHRLDQIGGAQRLFYIGPCFRAERPQKGRFRQFHQFGAEVIGSPDARADAEIIASMVAVYQAFGVTDTDLRINSLGSADSRARYRKALRAFLHDHASGLTETSRKRLETNPLRILDTKVAHERLLLQEAPLLEDFIETGDAEHFATAKRYLDDLGIDYVVDPLLVRGLDYYSRTAFELDSRHLGAQSALAGGGRYDGLATELGAGGDIPGVGFAAGIERLFLALEEAQVRLPGPTAPDAFLVALGERAEAWCVRQAMELRKAGLRVAYDLLGRSMKAQMKEVNRQNAPLAVIVGDRELDEGRIQVKDMNSGDQQGVSVDRLADLVVSHRDRRAEEASIPQSS